MSLPVEIKAEPTSEPRTLQEQRLGLRRQLAEQREIIAFQLTPSHQLRQSGTGRDLSYPRSLTMRLLTRNPAPVLKIAIGVATWLLGNRVSGMLQEGMQFIKMLRTGATLR